MVRISLCTLLLIFIAVIAPTSLFAARLELDVQPREGTTSDEFELRVTIVDTSETMKPTLIGGNDFEKVYVGPQSNVTIINGSISATVRHIYKLYPKKPGSLESPSARIELMGKTLNSQPLRINVRKEDLSNQKSKEISLEQHVNKTEAYVGEQIVNTIRLLSKKNLLEASFLDLTYKKVWVEEFGKQENYYKNIQGTKYSVNELKRALFPLIEGDIELPSRVIQVKYIDRTQQRSNPFSRFQLFDSDLLGFRQTKTKRISTGGTKLRVLPLPRPPQDVRAKVFPVGKTTISLGVNTDSIKLGGGKTVTFVVESQGNLHPLESIPLPEDQTMKIYPELPKTSYEQRDGRLITKKIFRYTLVPLKPGIFPVPVVKLPYFDPDSKSYEYATSRRSAFFVERGASTQQLPEQPLPERDEESTQDVKSEPIAYKPPQHGYIESIEWKTLFLVFAALSALCFAIFTFVRINRRRTLQAHLLTQIQHTDDAQELQKLYTHGLVSHFNLSVRDAGPRQVLDMLKLHALDSGLLFRIQSLYDTLNIALYGKRNEVPPLETVRAEIRELLEQIQ